jgi:glutamine amidotransferase
MYRWTPGSVSRSSSKRFTDEDRLIVSEPLSDLPGLWVEVPESTAVVVQKGADEHHPFRPQAPVAPPVGAIGQA